MLCCVVLCVVCAGGAALASPWHVVVNRKTQAPLRGVVVRKKRDLPVNNLEPNIFLIPWFGPFVLI